MKKITTISICTLLLYIPFALAEKIPVTYGVLESAIIGAIIGGIIGACFSIFKKIKKNKRMKK